MTVSSSSTSPRRVVVTGAGIVTGHGVGWTINAACFRTGATAFRPVSHFDVTRQRARVAAEVALPPWVPEGSRPKQAERRLDRAARLLILATVEATHQARWTRGSKNIPCVFGTTSGGMALGETYYRNTLQASGGALGQATRVAGYPAQAQARAAQDAAGISGPVTLIANACASGTNAIGHAFQMLRHGRAERVLSGGYDALSQLVFAGFDSLQALSTTRCRPFDVARDGLALGEGAGVLCLETLDHARSRGAAEILGEIIGYGAATDLHHLTQPHPDGNAAMAAMTAACRLAGVGVDQIDYINAHGTGTLLNDAAEAAAINRWAGANAGRVAVSSTKSGIGHLLGAAGAVEAVVCLMTLREQWLPPETKVESVDPVCRFRLVRAPEDARVEMVLSNSFGFGGSNGTLIFRRGP